MQKCKNVKILEERKERRNDSTTERKKEANNKEIMEWKIERINIERNKRYPTTHNKSCFLPGSPETVKAQENPSLAWQTRGAIDSTVFAQCYVYACAALCRPAGAA
jgi:hypothetical protein